MERKKSIHGAVRRSKYNVRNDAVGKLQRTLQGVVYDSVAERDQAAELDLLHKAKKISYPYRQVPFDLVVNGHKICRHVVDFYYSRGEVAEVLEVKGFETEVWKLKRKLFEALYPQVKYVVVKPKKSR